MRDNVLFKSLALLTKAEKGRGLIVLILAIFMGLFEVIGVASVVPFLTILANPNIINENNILKFTYQNLKFEDVDSFLIFLGIAAFLLIQSKVNFHFFVEWFAFQYENKRNVEQADCGIYNLV